MNVSARERIRGARKERGLSVRELARRLNVSPSLVSQIENGHTDPSVSTLYAIVGELGLSLDTLLAPHPPGPEAPTTGSTATHGGGSEPSTAPGTSHLDARGVGGPGAVRRRGPVVGPEERLVLEMDSGVVWERLTRGPGHGVEALLVTYDPGGSSSSSGKLMAHHAHEWAFLIEGELELHLGFDTYAIHAGESLDFPATTPHLYVNRSKMPARGIWYVLDAPSATTSLNAEQPTTNQTPQIRPASAVEALNALREAGPASPGPR